MTRLLVELEPRGIGNTLCDDSEMNTDPHANEASAMTRTFEVVISEMSSMVFAISLRDDRISNASLSSVT